MTRAALYARLGRDRSGEETATRGSSPSAAAERSRTPAGRPARATIG